MIEINLLPEGLRNRRPKAIQTRGKQLPLAFTGGKFLYLLPVALALLLATHLFLVVATISKNMRLGQLDQEWLKLGPEKKKLQELQKQYSTLTGQSQALQELAEKKINWAQKLNRLSLDLPSGIWFNELSFSSKAVNLKGSAISLTKEEMALINKFLDTLKKDPVFFKGLVKIELVSAARRAIHSYEVIDFVLQGVLEKK